MLDETYRDFLPATATPPHALFQDPAWRDGLVHLYSFSKAYCVPGHRVGAIIAGPAFRAELMKALDTWQICAAARRPRRRWPGACRRWPRWRAGNRDLMAGRAAGFRAARGRSCRAGGSTRSAPISPISGCRRTGRMPWRWPSAWPPSAGCLSLPGPFFGPGQDRHLRLAFANAALEAIAEVPARLAG